MARNVSRFLLVVVAATLTRSGFAMVECPGSPTEAKFAIE